MKSLNKVMLIGRLGGNPQMNKTGDGTPVCNFTIATNEDFMRGDEKIQNTTWHQVSVFSSLAELCQKWLKKGDLVYVEGKIKRKEYEDVNGNKLLHFGIVAKEVNFLNLQEKSSENNS
jgi:single-strand DNA-binding protein